MKKNNNTTNTLLLIIVVLLLIILTVLAGLYLTRTSFAFKKNGNSYGITNDKNPKTSSNPIPPRLKWHDPFEEKKEDDDKPKGSYLHYLSEKKGN